MLCYGQDKMACHLHLILCTWDVVITCTPVTIFFPLGVWLCLKKKERESEKKKVLSNVEDLTLTIRRLHTDNVVLLHRLFSTLIVYIAPTSHHAMR